MADDPERVGDLLVRVAELEAALGAIRDYADVKANVAAQHSDEEAGTLRVIVGMARDALKGKNADE